MIFINKYDLVLIHGVTTISHVFTLTFLILLVTSFLGWFKAKRNYIILAYSISFALMFVNICISLAYLETYISRSLVTYVKPYPIHFFLAAYMPSQLTEFLAALFDFFSLSSFLAIWTTTIAILYQYRYKLGRIRYFTLMCIPLVYYLFPFEAYLGGTLSGFMYTSPITFGILYVVIFSATKEVGSLLFSLSFWSASTLVADPRVRESLLISAIGMAILFGSIHTETLQYKIYPPYGLISESFMPLGSYFLLAGILRSTKEVSRSIDLRKLLYKSAETQLNLLKSISATDMENTLVKKSKIINRLLKEQEELQAQESELAKDEIRDIVRDVLNELYSKRNAEQK